MKLLIVLAYATSEYIQTSVAYKTPDYIGKSVAYETLNVYVGTSEACYTLES